jgi:hypothetical protein
VHRAYKHPQYDKVSLHFNVALLRIDCQMPFAIAAIKPVALPADENNFLQQVERIRVHMAGMGSANSTYHMPAHTLQQTELYSVLLNLCASHLPNADIQMSEICSRGDSGGTSSANSADEGGPLVWRATDGAVALFGLYSWTIYADGIATTGFHYVPTSLEWIHKVTNMKSRQIARMEQKVEVLKNVTKEVNDASTSVKEAVEHLAHATEAAHDASTIAILFGCVNTIIITIVMICMLVRCCRAQWRHRQSIKKRQCGEVAYVTVKLLLFFFCSHTELDEYKRADACEI